jgi:hypothetical protein
MLFANRALRGGRLLLVASAALVCFLVSPVPAGDKDKPAAKAITVEEVDAAQQAWCDGLVKIGKAYTDKKDYKAIAEKFIAETYDYKDGKVFFRPTLAVAPRAFRKTKEGALAYFVGGDKNFPEDKGFALAPWNKVRYDNGPAETNGIQIHGNIAITMGNVYLTGADGKEIFVDKTFVFIRGADGKLRLIVHKSALPNLPG